MKLIPIGGDRWINDEQEKARRDFVLKVLEATLVDDLEDALSLINKWRDAYVPAGSFGWAIEQLKMGRRVAREGWNGKGMWLMKIQGSNDIAKLHGYGFGEVLGEPTFADTVIIRTPGHMLVAWNASQQDMLADDWVIVK